MLGYLLIRNRFSFNTFSYGLPKIQRVPSVLLSTSERSAAIGIPDALEIRGIWEYASCRVMSGSTPEAELFRAKKKIGRVKFSAIRLEPTVLPLSCTNSPLAW